jgi:hypothetical protein
LSAPVVRSLAEAMRRGDWIVTHQGIAFDIHGVLVDGQHRLAAVVEAEVPVEMTVFTDVEPDTFDVLDTGKAAVTNHQIVATLDEHPKIRDFVSVGERVAAETGMIKSAAGAASYLVESANPKSDLSDWYEGIIDGAGLAKSDPRLMFRRTMFSMARKQAGVVQRRRDTREHVALYLKAFNAWATGEPLGQLRFAAREPIPAIVTIP